MVGIARAAQALGQCLSPLFSASLIEHRRKVLPIGMKTGTLLRLQVLGIALAVYAGWRYVTAWAPSRAEYPVQELRSHRLQFLFLIRR